MDVVGSPLAEQASTANDDGDVPRPTLKIDTSHATLIRKRSLETISEAARRRRSQSLATIAQDPLGAMFDHITMYPDSHDAGGGAERDDGGGRAGARTVSGYQRIQLAGVAVDNVELRQEETKVCRGLCRARALRAKWMDFFRSPAPNWGGLSADKYPEPQPGSAGRPPPGSCTPGRPRRHRPELPYAPFEGDIPGKAEGLAFQVVDGVVQVLRVHGGALDKASASASAAAATATAGTTEVLYKVPSAREFYADLFELQRIIEDGPTRSFAYRQLQLLDSRFSLHTMLNAEVEYAEQKQVPHRDFYNVRKVDTHIHHSACMSQKHLLRFIKSKLRHHSHDIVAKPQPSASAAPGGSTADADSGMTLLEVFQNLGLTAYDLNLDTLDMSASDTFHRFDRFNSKYNPCGQSQLREIFLKTDNFIQGRYLAELTQEVMGDLRDAKYQMAEWRISVYGRRPDEWTKLAKWVVSNKLVCPQVRWLIQVPRLYAVYHRIGLINSFQDMLDAIFVPLFKVTLDPGSDPRLHYMLRTVVGFDCVDDESKPEVLHSETAALELPTPEMWTRDDDPPYSYWLYYLRANLLVLNNLRSARGFSTFELRPHAGEAGHVNHLAAAYLAADKINHGIILRKSAGMQYLYYLDQIGIAVSPISNNKLFLDYDRSPFPAFFRIGMNVSLSTDDPLMLHMTADPLLEEYSVAAQVWKFSSVDLAEMARNSVLQSGFEHPFKRHFLGARYMEPGPRGNDIRMTNVPNVRLSYREELLTEHRAMVQRRAERVDDSGSGSGVVPAPPDPGTATNGASFQSPQKKRRGNNDV